MSNIRIKDITVFHPDNVVDNTYYIEHFREQGKDVSGLLEAMGREKRYINDDKNETPLTMAIKVTDSILEKTRLKAEDIDLLIFTTQTPETTLPSNALRLFDYMQGKHNTIVYDLNANCAGMTVALEQASHYMKSNTSIQNALIIGSDMWSLISDPTDPLCYTCFADGAAAIILERTEEDAGYIDAEYHVDTIFAEKMMFPGEGLTKGIQTNSVKYVNNIPFDGGIVLDGTYAMLDRLFKRNNLNPSDVKYCFSQFALSNILRIKEHFDIADEQVVYIGDRYGYNGTSSPFIALYEGEKSGQIKRGDYIIFWTIGAGFELVATLIKY
ncbi:MAG TPA: 3-oxoacyl-[acyl-carrier-protein] synthase III C-terminal domain-containing protein [Ureibacillus sp.]|nr:3-oxoacyl-[acyl-carrier-protein] synthase III C-terminal domain-containing protein [Ureibacillus sp.]